MQNEVVRAITADRGVRVAAIRANDMVREVMEVQTPAHSSQLLGELLMAAVLVREAMAPDLRVQLTLRSSSGMVFADSYPGGVTRGVVGGDPMSDDDELHLQVARVLANGGLHQGVVDVDSTDVSQALEHYMRKSEQVDSLVVLRAREDGSNWSCAGVLAQRLPDGTSVEIETVSEALAGADVLAEDAESTARTLCPGGLILSHHPVAFGCVCSHEKVVGAMATLGQEELAMTVAADETLTLTCEYCHTKYTMTAKDLKPLLTQTN